ncbi:MAG: GNAT family N-acetyltransferase [Candidatus Levyibacteriota bacterium]
MNLSNTVILTERLKLVPLSEEYAESIFKELTEEITRYMFPKSPDKIEETLEYIKSELPKIEKGEQLPVIILKKDTGEFIGGAGVHDLNTKTPTMGIWIKKSAHGNKYGLEAIKALKQWLDENISYNYISYPVDKDNIASKKIIEALNGIPEKEVQVKNMSGNILNEIAYRIYKK